MTEKTEQNVLTLKNHGWDLEARVMYCDSVCRVDVYTDRGQRLVKSHDYPSIRKALVAACDIVGED